MPEKKISPKVHNRILNIVKFVSTIFFAILAGRQLSQERKLFRKVSFTLENDLTNMQKNIDKLFNLVEQRNMSSCI